MINVQIAPQPQELSLVTINVRFIESVSISELRSAWVDVSSGTLQGHIQDAILLECARRGVNPQEITDP